MIIHLHFPLRGEFYPLDFQTGFLSMLPSLSNFSRSLKIVALDKSQVFPLIIGVTMAFFRMQFVKFNNRFFNLRVCWCHFEGKCNTQHFEFFWQNHEKSKYRFWTFLPVTWVKIELQRPTIHQMNGWNLYFLAYFMPSIRKLNLRGPRTSDISLKFIESPFKLFQILKFLNCPLSIQYTTQFLLQL